MDLGDIVRPDGILPRLCASSKKQALQELAKVGSRLTGLDERDIFDTLLQRERLGSTGLGRGIAIPHVKMQGVDEIVCVFARLTAPIAFEALDDEPVDLIFLLIAPEHASGDHLKALARISRLVRAPAALDALRRAPDADAIRALLADHAIEPPAAA